MRPSSKDAILDAALRLAGRGGIGSLTLDAAAKEAGVSKGGLIYHFATKEQLIIGTVEHFVRSWEDSMLLALGTPFDDASPTERVRAYTQVCASDTASRADLALLIDSVHDENVLAAWRDLLVRWLDVPYAPPDPVAVDLAVARLAADGLWLAEATDTAGMDDALRRAVVARIDTLVGSVEDPR